MLRFARADGSEIAFRAPAHVWCGPWEPDVPVEALHVVVGTKVSAARWELWAVLADIEQERTVRFPSDFAWSDPVGAQVFVHDPPNEASTQTEGSAGEIVFDEITCEEGVEIVFTADVVIGSEFSDGEPISVSGTFRAPVGAPAELEP